MLVACTAESSDCLSAFVQRFGRLTAAWCDGDLLPSRIGATEWIRTRGGNAATLNGGTVKLFYGTYTGEKPAAAGRGFDAGNNSFQRAMSAR